LGHPIPKTTYGLTGERVVIVSGLFARNVKSLNLRTLSDVSLNERRDGSGTITFGPGHPYSSWFQGMGWWPGMPAAASAFELMPRADSARKLVSSIAEVIGATPGPSPHEVASQATVRRAAQVVGAYYSRALGEQILDHRSPTREEIQGVDES
jgi:hypothetical protein